MANLVKGNIRSTGGILQRRLDTVRGAIAVIQMTSGPDVAANLAETRRLVAHAAASGAGLIVLPENFALMGVREEDKLAAAEPAGAGPLQDLLAELATRHHVWIVGGTVPLASSDSDRAHAACLLYDERGECVARYDKMHLFDVMLENGERYLESRTTIAGDRIVVADTPWGRLGLAVCYDLRFPGMFRAMLDHGAEIIALPAAFTAVTGRAHWEVLLRSRAIENQCFVAAAAQSGMHGNGRETWGGSMIVDPWGSVIERLERGAGAVCAPCDREQLQRIRRSFPVLDHRRELDRASGRS